MIHVGPKKLNLILILVDSYMSVWMNAMINNFKVIVMSSLTHYLKLKFIIISSSNLTYATFLDVKANKGFVLSGPMRTSLAQERLRIASKSSELIFNVLNVS